MDWLTCAESATEQRPLTNKSAQSTDYAPPATNKNISYLNDIILIHDDNTKKIDSALLTAQSEYNDRMS